MCTAALTLFMPVNLCRHSVHLGLCFTDGCYTAMRFELRPTSVLSSIPIPWGLVSEAACPHCLLQGTCPSAHQTCFLRRTHKRMPLLRTAGQQVWAKDFWRILITILHSLSRCSLYFKCLENQLSPFLQWESQWYYYVMIKPLWRQSPCGLESQIFYNVSQVFHILEVHQRGWPLHSRMWG